MAMFKHILIPTDGSEIAAKAISTGIAFAKECGARVTGYYAIEEMNMHHVGAHMTKELSAELDKRSREVAEAQVAEIEKAAKAAGVPFDAIVGKVVQPFEGIIEAAKKSGADLIMMSSHGRRGLSGLLIGSVTQRVLSHSSIPVMVLR